MSDDNSKKRPASASLSDFDTSGANAQTLKTPEITTPANKSNVFPVFTEAKQGKRGKRPKLKKRLVVASKNS